MITLVDVGEGDRGLAVVADVLAAANAADGQDAVDEATTRRLRHHGLAGSTLWLAGDSGFALRFGTELDLVVRPDARRDGVGTSLASAALAAPGELFAWSHGDDPAARVLAARLGFEAVRELWVMRLELASWLAGSRQRSLALAARPAEGGYSARPAEADDVPDPALAARPAEGGDSARPAVSIRSYRDSDAAEVLRINAAAFAHHPEQGEMDAADLAERMGEDWFDPAGLLLAEDDSGVLGFHWTKRHSATLGEVYVVGIDPAAQGRGLGKALTRAGLEHLAAGGSTDVLLYVEADNHPARAVYAGLGFEHAQNDTHVQYHRPQ